MRPLATVLVMVGALTLTGCAPTIDDAFDNCVEVTSAPYLIDYTLTTEDKLRAFKIANEVCADIRDEDEEKFLEAFGDLANN